MAIRDSVETTDTYRKDVAIFGCEELLTPMEKICTCLWENEVVEGHQMRSENSHYIV